MKDEKTQELILKENINVIEANELIRSKQDELTLSQARFLRLAISQILKDETDFKTYTCSLYELAKFFGSSKGNIAREIYKTIEYPDGHKELKFLNELLDKKIYIPKRDTKTGALKINPKTGIVEYTKFQWVTTVEYYSEEIEGEKKNKADPGRIKIKLNEELKPYLMGLTEFYTGYGYSVLLELPSYNAIRLYELIMSYANITLNGKYNKYYLYGVHGTKIADIAKNEIPFRIDDLRVYFNCDEKDRETGKYIKYPNNRDFLKWVIEKNLKLISEKAHLNIHTRTIKEDNTTRYVIFIFDRQTPEQIQAELKALREYTERKKREGK